MSDTRVHSRNPKHLRDDLAASLAFALGNDPDPSDVTKAANIIESVESFDDSQQCLHDVRTGFGPQMFGRVTLFHLAASTSLRGQSEVLTHGKSLEDAGMTVRDLAWPASQLNDFYYESAVENPELEKRLDHAVAAWKEQVGA